MMISNLVPLMKHKFGPEVLKLFSPSAVERMEGCTWDSSIGTVIGLFGDEISSLDENDPMKPFVKPSFITHKNSASTAPTTDATITSDMRHLNVQATGSLLHEMDDDSVLTLGNNTHHRWTAPTSTRLPHPLSQRPTIPLTPTDEAAIGSISTLTTRITTRESQYNQISGAVQDIKTMQAG